MPSSVIIEFLQFHPTALKLPGVNPAPLISEAVRGAGAVLLDKADAGLRWSPTPAESWPPVTSWPGRWRRQMQPAEPGSTRARWMTSQPGFPASPPCCARYGLDPARDLLPVAPALHYAMGGIQTDLQGRTTKPGLWAVGEVARTGVHGANRLGIELSARGSGLCRPGGPRAGGSAAYHRPERARPGSRRWQRQRGRCRLRADPRRRCGT